MKGGPVLKPKDAKNDAREITYSPLAVNTCLFQRFARTRLTHDGITTFANEFGPLGFKDEKGRIKVELEGEPFGAWEDSIMDMRWAIVLWVRYLHERPIETPQWVNDHNFVNFTLDKKHSFQSNDLSMLLEKQRILVERLLNNTPSILDFSIQSPILSHLLPLIDKYLRYVNQAMYPDTSNGIEELKRMDFPYNLLGAIWLQFSDAVSENKQYRKCDMCDTWFEIAPGRGRKKKHCSNACRVKLYRESKKEVIT